MILLIQTTTEKFEFIAKVLHKIKVCNLKNVFFEEKGPKVKNLTTLNFMTTLYYFALNIETGWYTRVVKPILKSKNVNDIC